jgi:predicted PurR-regulated permease PerM
MALTITVIGFVTLALSVWASNRQINARIDQVSGQLNTRIDQVNARIDGLQRDISGLSDRVARIEGHLGMAAEA